MKIKLLAAVLAVGLGVSLGRAQEMPKPGPEHEKLKALVGEWDATIKHSGGESKGKTVISLDFGGFFAIEDFNGEFGGMKFKGRGQHGYCPIQKKYFNVWIDSMSASPVMFTGNYDKDGKTLTELGEGPGMDGKMMKMKSVTTLQDADTMVFTMYDITSGKDVEMMSITYKRKK